MSKSIISIGFPTLAREEKNTRHFLKSLVKELANSPSSPIPRDFTLVDESGSSDVVRNLCKQIFPLFWSNKTMRIAYPGVSRSYLRFLDKGLVDGFSAIDFMERFMTEADHMELQDFLASVATEVGFWDDVDV